MKTLVVGPSWVGDMVMAHSLFQVIRESNPSAQISVLAPAWSAPILGRMPEIKESITMPVGHGQLQLSMRWKLGRQLSQQFDQAIVLPGSLKSALIPWIARIKKRTGYIGEQRYGLLNDLRRLNQETLPFSVQRFVALGEPKNSTPRSLNDIPKPRLQHDPANCLKLRQQFSINNSPLYVLCPGAEFGPAKQWPAKYFAAVARNRLQQGTQVIILGSHKDQQVAAEIIASAAGCLDLTGKTSLADAVDLMSMATAVITNDSGLMHIAAAMDRHVIALYGSSTDTFTPPLCQHANRLSLDLPCRPCFKRQCPLGHLDCLVKLTPDRVIDLFD